MGQNRKSLRDILKEQEQDQKNLRRQLSEPTNHGGVRAERHEPNTHGSDPTRYMNPSNGHVEMAPSVAWLWALLFGGFYLMVRGLWGHVAIWFLAAIGLGVAFGNPLPVIVLSIAYAVTIGGIIDAKYLRAGWIKLLPGQQVPSLRSGSAALPSGRHASAAPPLNTDDAAAPTEKQCPYCAETIKAAAIRCRYCHADLPPMEPPAPVAAEPTIEPHAPSPPPPAPRPAATENSSSFGPQILGGIVIGGILLFAWVMQQDGKPAPRTASALYGEVRYTGKMRIDSGAEYVALEEPSYIGGACDGWSAVEIREPGATRGMRSQLCWRRDGGMIHVTTKSGAEITPSHYSVWRD